MTYLTLPPPRVPVKDKSYYACVPDALILEIDKEVNAFFEAAEKMRSCELYIDEVLAEIMLYIGDANFLETGIQALQAQFREIHVQGGIEPEEVEIVVNAVGQLARAMVEKFMSMGAYLPDGCLPFELGKKWVAGCETPIFIKQDDYKTTIQNEDNNEYYRNQERHYARIQSFGRENVGE